MKKILSMIAFFAIFSFSTFAAAEISPSEVALGGIPLGASPEYLKSVYGEPTSYDKSDDGVNYGGVIYNYNNTFKVYYADGKYMYWLETTANNGIGTPSGIRVGMPESVLEKYGETYFTRQEGNVTTKAYWARGRIVLEFRIANGKIISIKGRC